MKKIALLLALMMLLPLLALAENTAAYEDGKGLFNEGKYDEALALWETLAAGGDAKSIYALGMIHTGAFAEFNLPADPEKSLVLFTQGAEFGDGDCMYALGYYYRKGLFTGEEDLANALTWYQRAADAGHAEAAYAAGGIYYSDTLQDGTRDYANALPWFTRGAELGSGKAAYFAGQIIHDNKLGLETPDYAAAHALFTQAVATEHAFTDDALFRLGKMARNGEHLPQDVQQALDYYRQSAALGNYNAMHDLGEMYRLGEVDGSPDPDVALEWYLKAAELGRDCAVGHIEDLLQTGGLSEESLSLAAQAGYAIP